MQLFGLQGGGGSSQQPPGSPPSTRSQSSPWGNEMEAALPGCPIGGLASGSDQARTMTDCKGEEAVTRVRKMEPNNASSA